MVDGMEDPGVDTVVAAWHEQFLKMVKGQPGLVRQLCLDHEVVFGDIAKHSKWKALQSCEFT